MAVAVLIIELLILIVICGLVLRIFASWKRTPVYAIASTMLGWIMCFAIALLVPIDIVDVCRNLFLMELRDNIKYFRLITSSVCRSITMTRPYAVSPLLIYLPP